ncbi:MAG: DedA family protein [Patescibacteria group bacterium]|nr:DedA family protein [Patescibacteria group bacterium]
MFEFSVEELSRSLPSWGYPIMLLLMIVEGPIVTMLAAFLASLGIFSWVVVFVLSVTGDILGDVILYAIGFFGGKRVADKSQKMLGVGQEMIERLEKRFDKSGAKIVFYVKSTTGLCWIAFILAGTVRMPFQKFLVYSLLGGVVWSGILVGLGYFFGFAAEQIDRYIKFAGWAIFAVALLVFVYITAIKKKLLEKFFVSGNKIEKLKKNKIKNE